MATQSRGALCNCLPSVLVAHFVLSMDAASIHVHAKVADTRARLGLWLVIVPAHTTWLLQPLDIHVFLKFKRYLRAAFQYHLLRPSETEETPSQVIVRLIVRAIARVIQAEPWRLAFLKNGFP